MNGGSIPPRTALLAALLSLLLVPVLVLPSVAGPVVCVGEDHRAIEFPAGDCCGPAAPTAEKGLAASRRCADCFDLSLAGPIVPPAPVHPGVPAPVRLPLPAAAAPSLAHAPGSTGFPSRGPDLLAGVVLIS